MNADFDRTRRCAEHFRRIGLCPLPSRMDVKGPMLPTYAEFYQGQAVPESVYRDWRTTNVQILTGTKTPTPSKIIVVDCDGEEALPVWLKICEANNHNPEGTWVCRTGSGGYHFYYSLSATVSLCPSGMLWGIWDTWGDSGKGKWLKHKEVRILGDNSLVIAPPSKHIETGDRYAFDGRANPNKIMYPAIAPSWLIEMPRLVAPRFTEPPAQVVQRSEYIPTGTHYSREEVIAAVGMDKFAIATKEWGLQAASNTPNANGWSSCFVPGREDTKHSRPSGSFCWKDGTFQDRKDMSSISFFDLSVVLGRYDRWQDCRDDLGQRYIGKRCR